MFFVQHLLVASDASPRPLASVRQSWVLSNGKSQLLRNKSCNSVHAPGIPVYQDSARRQLAKNRLDGGLCKPVPRTANQDLHEYPYTMPQESPAIGDVWIMHDVLRDDDIPAVIVSAMEGSPAWNLMTRAGRIVAVPERTLFLNWRYRCRADGSCVLKECSGQACVRTVEGEWFCGAHAPRNQAFLLAGDDDISNPTINSLANCPVCKAPTPPDPYWEVVGGLSIYRCDCRARWVPIILRGSPEDGIYLGDDLQKAYDLMETALCSPITILIGSRALSALRTNFPEVQPSNPSLLGMRLTFSQDVGSLSVVLCGRPVASTTAPKNQPLRLSYEVGDEYELDDKAFTVTSILKAIVLLEHEPSGEIRRLTHLEMRALHKIVRKTAYQMLMDDDDLV